MLTLVLVRHAKSDWNDPSQADHDRPLNSRGERNAPLMARRIAAMGMKVDRLISSTALRARTTAAFFADVLDVEIELDVELYGASSSTLIDKAANAGVKSVMLVAHNPGLSYLAERLSNGAIVHMPTCAVARFSWQAESWDEVEWQEPVEWTLDTPR